jgi:hypothetical protein
MYQAQLCINKIARKLSTSMLTFTFQDEGFLMQICNGFFISYLGFPSMN